METPQNLRYAVWMASQIVLDAMDLRILARLQMDGRITNHALANHISLSPSACLARVRRMEKSGVVRGYHASVAPTSLGLGVTLYAEVTLARHNSTALAYFESEVRRLDAVVEAVQVSGSYDYLLKVAVPDMSAWISLSDNLMENPLVARIITLVVLKDTKRFTGYR